MQQGLPSSLSDITYAPTAQTLRRGEIRSLTGLRGIAATFVVIFHFMEIYRGSDEPNWSAAQFVSHGYLSVDLFFVLSGFVLALNYGPLPSTNRWQAYKLFLGHRLARIYPLYFCVTIFAGIVHGSGLFGLHVMDQFPATLLANVFMVQSWGLAQSLVWPAWSISTEWTAYLLFPLLLEVSLRRGGWIAAGAAVFSIACLPALAWGGWWGIPFDQRTGPLDMWAHQSAAPVLRCLSEFTLGLITYRVFRATTDSHARVIISICPVIAAAMLLLLCVYQSDVAVVLLFPALILGLAWDKGPASRLLGSRIPHALGVFSYSIYLVHPYFNHIVDLATTRLAAVPVQGARSIATTVVTVITVGAASAVFQFVERPGRRAVRSVADRLSATPSA